MAYPNNCPNMNLNNQMNYNNMNYNQINPMMNNMLFNIMNPMNNQMNMIQQQQLQNQNNQENDAEPHMHIFNSFPFDEMLNYISDKKRIIFRDIMKNESITKNIPIHFTKNELYSFVNEGNCSKTILFYNNNILDDDDSSINDIPDNSTILLFIMPSFENFRNSSFYKYLLNLYQNNVINIIAAFNSGKKFNFPLPSEISISLMIKIFVFILGTDIKDSYLACGGILNVNDGRKIKKIYSSNQGIITIISKKNISSSYFVGTKIKVAMFFKNQNVFKFYEVYKYSPISRLFSLTDDDAKLRIKKIIYNGKELNKDDTKSIASLGVKDVFGCFVET